MSLALESAPAALVTGAARRLGRGVALELARRGWNVVVHHHTSRDEAELVATEIRALGCEAVSVAADLFVPTSAVELFQAAHRSFPNLSLVVNNASIFEPGSFAETTPELLDRNLAIHLRTPFLLIQELDRALAAEPPTTDETREGLALGAATSRGQVINLLDTRVARDVVDHFAYTLSKKALADLTRLAARALAPRIRVNAVAPGVILPPPGATDAYLERRAASVPLQRVGTVDAINRAVGYLLDNPFVTGQVLFVDGGEHLL